MLTSLDTEHKRSQQTMLHKRLSAAIDFEVTDERAKEKRKKHAL
jgi:hypothetical protein